MVSDNAHQTVISILGGKVKRSEPKLKKERQRVNEPPHFSFVCQINELEDDNVY